MSVFHNNALIGAGGGAEAVAAPGVRSLRFNSGDSPYLNRTPSSAGNRKTFTFSAWVKRSSLTAGSPNGPVIFSADTGNAPWTAFQFETSDGTLQITTFAGSSLGLKTNAAFRDTSAWYHLVIAFDTTQSTASDRVKCYVNGVAQTFSNTNYPAQNSDTKVNGTFPQYIGFTNNQHFDGYLTDCYLIDGLQLTATSFGSYDSNGVWQRGTYSGTYGTNGFHILDFENEGTIGDDSSGNSNDFTANNLSDTAGAGNDVLLDFPVNGSESDTGAGGEVSGNYCVFNVLNKGNDVTLSNGNLQAACTSSSKDGVFGTIGVSSGKWYWEVELTSSDSNTNAAIGIATSVLSPDAGSPTSAGAYFYSSFNGNKWLNSADSSYGASYGTGDVIGVALDLDNDTLTFYKNGSTQGDATTSLPSGTYFPYVGDGANNSAQTVIANWGQRSFSHSAPSGYKALCTTNLPTPTIADGSDYFDTLLYTGNETARSITGLSFSPDLVWLKNRDTSGYHHYWVDIVRGSDKNLFSNLTEGEQDAARLSSLDSNGFGLTNHSGPNKSGDDYVAWCFDGGSSTVSNTDGSQTTNVRANQSAGFSICTYSGGGSGTANSDSGDSFGHGLNAAPDLVICKKRSGANGWPVYHSATALGALNIQSTATLDTGSYLFAQQHPSNSVVYLGNNPEINATGHTYVAYCFTAVAGFSAAGKYEGNGSSDGPFVHTGFKVKWLLLRKYNSGNNNWYLYDVARDQINPATKELLVDTSSAENPYNFGFGDFLSNGFKIRTTEGSINSNGASVLYVAFASNPFQANGGLAR